MSILEHFAFSSHPHHATQWGKGEPEMEKLNFDILFVETFCLLRRNNVFYARILVSPSFSICVLLVGLVPFLGVCI